MFFAVSEGWVDVIETLLSSGQLLLLPRQLLGRRKTNLLVDFIFYFLKDLPSRSRREALAPVHSTGGFYLQFISSSSPTLVFEILYP